MIKRTLLPLLSVALIVSGCSYYAMHLQLGNASSLLHEEQFEDALLLLNSIEYNKIRLGSEKALYCLLMCDALLGNGQSITSDTLTSYAVEYYSHKRNKHKRMLSNYYEGMFLRSTGSYQLSVLYLEKAFLDASDLHDDMYLGRITRAISYIMNETNNLTESIRYCEESVSYFNRSGALLHEVYAKASLAINYVIDHQYKKADSLLNILYEDNPPDLLLQQCKLVEAEVLVEYYKQYHHAIEIYRDIDSSLFYLTDYSFYALALNSVGQKEASNEQIQRAYTAASSKADSATIDYTRAIIEFSRRNYELAYRLVKNAAETQDSVTRVLLKQSVSSAQRDFFKEEARLQETEKRLLRNKYLYIIALLLFIAILTIIYIRSWIRSKDQIIKDLMADIAIEKRTSSQVLKDNAHLLGSLFGERIGHLDRLADLYYATDDPEERDQLFKDFKSNALSIRSDKGLFNSLEADLNRYCNGIMEKLKAQVPSIKGENLIIIMLFFAGIPNITVQLIMNKNSRKAVEMDRSRYRSAIKNANAQDSDLFLTMLEIKKRPYEKQ